MENLIKWLGGVSRQDYRNVCIQRDVYFSARNEYMQEIRELRQYVSSCEKTISEQGRELKRLRESHDPFRGCIDQNSRHASQTRIRDLEALLRKNGINPV